LEEGNRSPSAIWLPHLADGGPPIGAVSKQTTKKQGSQKQVSKGRCTGCGGLNGKGEAMTFVQGETGGTPDFHNHVETSESATRTGCGLLHQYDGDELCGARCTLEFAHDGPCVCGNGHDF
jgi:hypothetical protein